jgi:hypothetical protein
MGREFESRQGVGGNFKKPDTLAAWFGGIVLALGDWGFLMMRLKTR